MVRPLQRQREPRLRALRAASSRGRAVEFTAAAVAVLLAALVPTARGLGDDTISVHVVAHSHCDAGYRLTVDGYMDTHVQQILDTVVEELSADVRRHIAAPPNPATPVIVS